MNMGGVVEVRRRCKTGPGNGLTPKSTRAVLYLARRVHSPLLGRIRTWAVLDIIGIRCNVGDTAPPLMILGRIIAHNGFTALVEAFFLFFFNISFKGFFFAFGSLKKNFKIKIATVNLYLQILF